MRARETKRLRKANNHPHRLAISFLRNTVLALNEAVQIVAYSELVANRD